jgi:hypothetical protein
MKMAQKLLVQSVQNDSTATETKSQLERFVTNTELTKEDQKVLKDQALVGELLTHRPYNFKITLFAIFVSEKMEENEAKAEKEQKRAAQYLDLLDDFYCRSN